jgi:hypothetical protein
MGIERAATKTPCTPQAFVDALVTVWPSELGGTPSLAAACVLAAQFSLETARGTSMVCWNFGNEKAPDPTTVDYCYFTTWEDLPAKAARIALQSPLCAPKNPPLADDPADDPPIISVLFHPKHPTCRFRAFATLGDGTQHYLRAMWSHWTLAWSSVCAGDPEGFAQGLHDQKPPYYTADPAIYKANMRAYFNQYIKTLTVPVDPLSKTDPDGLPIV